MFLITKIILTSPKKCITIYCVCLHQKQRLYFCFIWLIIKNIWQDPLLRIFGDISVYADWTNIGQICGSALCLTFNLMVRGHLNSNLVVGTILIFIKLRRLWERWFLFYANSKKRILNSHNKYLVAIIISISKVNSFM